MPFFLHQASYTPEALARLIANPIEELGGKIKDSFFTFGDHDVMLITEMPDNVSAAAIAVAFAGGGALKSFKTTPLMTTAEALDALRKAGSCGYKPLTAGAAAGAS
jgi:uncharacterized protein with GYD domain